MSGIEGVTAAIALDWLIGKVCDEGGARITEGAIRRFFQRRAETAREIAFSENRAGRGNILLNAPEADEVIAILWRYLRTAEEGAARLNLRLMAAILAGQSTFPPLFASEFLRWSELIASLSNEEVHFLAVLHKECSRQEHGEADQAAQRLLIPRVFADSDEYMVTGFALLRTGLVRQTSVGFESNGLGMDAAFATTPRMAQLARLVDLEGVLEREAAATY